MPEQTNDGPAVLLVPGLWNSGPEHWQSYWEREMPNCTRVQQSDWETPSRVDWVAELDRAVAAADGGVVLVAHSLGCAAVAYWALGAAPALRAQVRGALLVAPSDTEAPSYPPGTSGFSPMPMERLPFPSTVVASSDDEYVTVERAAAFAHKWDSQFVNIGARGHINSASLLGDWPEGLALLRRLVHSRQ